MNQALDRLNILLALLYAGAGLLLGNVMGATQDHGQLVTHAHIMMLGWVTMGLFGLIYRSWPELKPGLLPLLSFAAHQIGTLGMTVSLYLLYAGGMEATLGPILGGCGILIMIGWALFAVLFLIRTSGKPAVS